MKEIDARGLACPAPVLQTKAAIEKQGADAVQVVVDNPAAQQNVQRFMESKGFTTTVEQAGADLRITGRAATAGALPPDASPSPVHRPQRKDQQKIMIVCATDRIGVGDDTLGQKLMVNFINTLAEMDADLWQLVFINNGVKLTIDGSPVLAALQAYEADGVAILACGTCLEHFSLLERKQVGTTTNMLDIVTAMQLADKVISV